MKGVVVVVVVVLVVVVVVVVLVVVLVVVVVVVVVVVAVVVVVVVVVVAVVAVVVVVLSHYGSSIYIATYPCPLIVPVLGMILPCGATLLQIDFAIHVIKNRGTTPHCSATLDGCWSSLT